MPHLHPDISDLTARAALVWDITTDAGAAAARLFGVVRAACRDHGMEAVRQGCSLLARSDGAWRPPLVTLPYHDHPGVDESVRRIASFAAGLLNLHGAEAVRAALAFWATEEDPARWQIVIDLAARGAVTATAR